MRVLLTGTSGYLGTFLEREMAAAGHEIVALTRREEASAGGLTQVNWSRLDGALAVPPIEAAIHCAALADPAKCESDPAGSRASNVELTARICEFTESRGIFLITVSTDLVFEGAKAPPGGFREDASPVPLSVYARSKHEAESATIRRGDSCVARISLLYGPPAGERRGALGWMIDAFSAGQPVTLFHDEFRTPIHVADAARALRLTAERRVQGILHVAGPERVSRVDFGGALAQAAGFDPKLIVSQSIADSNATPPRAPDVSLNAERLREEIGFEPRGIKEGMKAAIPIRESS